MNIKLKEYENKEYENIDKKISGVYPLLDDKDFNIKIANKKEFNSHKYVQCNLAYVNFIFYLL